jgi:predicted sulfurtransferase
MMRMLLALLTVALLGHTHAGAAVGTPAPQALDAPRISQQDFKKLIAAKNVIIVDTRNEDAFPLGHIPGAILLPLEGQMTWPDSYEKTVATLLATPKTVVTYCA